MINFFVAKIHPNGQLLAMCSSQSNRQVAVWQQNTRSTRCSPLPARIIHFGHCRVNLKELWKSWTKTTHARIPDDRRCGLIPTVSMACCTRSSFQCAGSGIAGHGPPWHRGRLTLVPRRRVRLPEDHLAESIQNKPTLWLWAVLALTHRC